MKSISKNISITCLLLALFVQTKLSSQALVGPAPFCMPMYGAWAIPCNQGGPSNSAGNWINDFINSFNTTGAVINITNNNSGCNSQNFPSIGQRNYFFHGCQHYLVVNPGQVITCNVQNGIVFGQGNSVFIDWNGNGVFNLPAERVCATAGAIAGPAFHPAMNFVVPAAQPAGTYRMRVRCAWATPGNSIDPCNMHGYGETEDYNVYVGITPPGVITATASNNGALCNGSQLNLNVQTSAQPTAAVNFTYTWSGPGGYTANIANPLIASAQPTNSGVYSVTVNPGSCPITVQTTVNVYPTPTITALANNGPSR